MTKALMVGFGVLLAAYALWFITLQNSQYSELKVLILWVSPFVAAIVSAFLAPKRKFMLGISMAFPAAILAVGLNYVYQVQGNPVDLPGGSGALILFTTTMIYSGILCGVGAVIGQALSDRSIRS
jgi:phosphoglycerol transferase MdoB-like AlkP superfamily enzyme